MLAALLLGSLGLLVVSTALLFAPGPPGSGVASRPLAATASALVGALTAGALWLVGVPVSTAGAVAAVIALVGFAWLPATRHWNARGHVAWTAITITGPTYLAFMMRWTMQTDLGVAGTIGGLALWTLELFAFVLGLMYGWELVDVLARRRWLRRCPGGVSQQQAAECNLDEDDLPFVSLHVPAYNEPPDMVIATLTSLLALDYPSYEILMVDDNTTDPELWEPVRDFCFEHDIRFVHLQDWPGFKSGALNWALAHTDPRAEVVGVIDADYLVEPDYLRRCAPLFTLRPELGFVQTPQDYRDWEHDSYFRRLYYSYEYFFAVSQVSRNERDGAIFGGTMGLIRRSALDDVGGWDEWCITEDAELSLRLLAAGWSGQHVERSFGHGVMPLTFEALKGQRFRWCFGGVQILRKHWRILVPFGRGPASSLSAKQRYDYLAGGVQWFGDLLAMAFAVLLTIGALSVAFGSGLVFRRLSGALLVVPPALIGLGMTRAIGLIRRNTGASWRDAAGALGVWLTLSPTVAKACVLGLVHRDGVFLRTPKTRGEQSWRVALRANRTEAIAGAVLLLLVPAAALRADTGGALLLTALLAWHGFALVGAPLQSRAALMAALTPELAERRASEDRRDRAAVLLRPLRVGAAVVALGALGAAVSLLLTPVPEVREPLPDVVAQARGVAPSTTTVPPSEGDDADERTSVTTTTVIGDDAVGQETTTEPVADGEPTSGTAAPAVTDPGAAVVDDTPAAPAEDPAAEPVEQPTVTEPPAAPVEEPAPAPAPLPPVPAPAPAPEIPTTPQRP